MEYRKYILCFLSLCSFANINADTVLVKGITFSDRNKELFVLKTGLNIEKYLFKKEKSKNLFEKLIECIKDNNELYKDLQKNCNSRFNDLKIDKPEDIDNFFNNFYYKDISKGEYSEITIHPDHIDKKELYLNLKIIPKITYKIENEDIINDNIVKDIKELFDEYLNDNNNYPFNVNKLLNYYKQYSGHINPHFIHLRYEKFKFKIISNNSFTDIHNQYAPEGEIDKKLNIDYPLDLTISFEKQYKIYKTNLNFYINGDKKDTLLIDECYNIKDFNLKNHKYVYIDPILYHFNLLSDDYNMDTDDDLREINIKIKKPSAIRYEITDTANNKHIIYSGDKLTERQIVAIVEKYDQEKYVLYENSDRVDVDRKLENEKYEIDKSNICYTIRFTDSCVNKFYFYKKATFNELKKIFKNSLGGGSLLGIGEKNVIDPNSVLEPGEYKYAGNTFEELKGIKGIQKGTGITQNGYKKYFCC